MSWPRRNVSSAESRENAFQQRKQLIATMGNINGHVNDNNARAVRRRGPLLALECGRPSVPSPNYAHLITFTLVPKECPGLAAQSHTRRPVPVHCTAVSLNLTDYNIRCLHKCMVVRTKVILPLMVTTKMVFSCSLHQPTSAKLIRIKISIRCYFNICTFSWSVVIVNKTDIHSSHVSVINVKPSSVTPLIYYSASQ